MKIYNEAGEEILYAHQKGNRTRRHVNLINVLLAFSWGHDLKIYSQGGEQLGEVKQKVLLFLN
jgi:hypothetical protein